MTHDYGYRKERDGYEVWSLSPHTGDRRDLIDTVRSKRDAQRLIARLRRTSGKDANPFAGAAAHFVPADSLTEARIDFVTIIERNLELASQAGAVLGGDLSSSHISDVLQHDIHNFDLRNFVYGLYCDAFYRELDKATSLMLLVNQPEQALTITELTIGSDWARITLWDVSGAFARTGETLYQTHLATVYSYGTSDWGHENRDGNSNRL